MCLTVCNHCVHAFLCILLLDNKKEKHYSYDCLKKRRLKPNSLLYVYLFPTLLATKVPV